MKDGEVPGREIPVTGPSPAPVKCHIIMILSCLSAPHNSQHRQQTFFTLFDFDDFEAEAIPLPAVSTGVPLAAFRLESLLLGAMSDNNV